LEKTNLDLNNVIEGLTEERDELVREYVNKEKADRAA